MTTHKKQKQQVNMSIFHYSPLWRELFSEGSTSTGFKPLIDVEENEHNIIIHVEVPGVSEKDLKVTCRDSILEIQGAKVNEKKDDKTKVQWNERAYGKFYRSIQLPAGVDPKNLKAIYNHGVLTVVVNKPEKERDVDIPISKL